MNLWRMLMPGTFGPVIRTYIHPGPPVLPNLQRIPPTRPLAPEELELNGHDIYFYDDVATLRQEWSSQNTENVGELLIDFFKYFSKEFSYSKDVISLRTEGGLMTKDSKSWNADVSLHRARPPLER